MPRTTTTTVHPQCPDLANPLGDLGKPDFLEQYVVGPFRLWHMIFLCSGGLLTLIILVCCIFRVRIPRTKQEIETDFKRKKLTRKFRWHLNKMNIEDTNLKAALDLVRERVDEDPQIENGEVLEGGESVEEEGRAGSDATPASVRSGTTAAAVTPNSIARSAALIAQSSTEDEITKASDTTSKKKEKKSKTKKKNQDEEKEEETQPKEEAKKEKTGKKKKKKDKADTSANS